MRVLGVYLLFLLLISLTSCSSGLFGKKDDAGHYGTSRDYQGDYKRSFGGKKGNVSDYYDQKIEEYKERMKENAKERMEREREMAKPQHANPMYFGHKKPPKKRPVGKRKFCEECGIVH